MIGSSDNSGGTHVEPGKGRSMTANGWFSGAGRWARSVGGCLVVSLALVCVVLPATASNAAVMTTTIDDDTLAVGSQVSQYPASDPEINFPSIVPGFTFGAAPGNGVLSDQDCLGPPTVEAVPDTHTPPNAMQLPLCGASEFPDHGVFAALTGTADAVSAYVGDPGGFDDPFELDAYDSAGNLLGTTTMTTPDNPADEGILWPISYSQPGVFTIAYVAIYLLGTTDHNTIGMDDFSVEWGGGVPAITLTSVPGGTFAPGVTVQRTLTIGRLNGSDGNVDLSIAGLPPTEQVTFSPSVLTGTNTTSQVTITVDATAQPGQSGGGTVIASPETPEVGSGPVSAPLGIGVVAPFTVTSEYPTLSVEPCSKAATDVTTRIAGGFAGTPVNLGLTDTGTTPDFSSITLQDPSLSNPGDFSGGANTQAFTVVRDEQPGPGGSFDVKVTPTSGMFTEPALTITVDRASPDITSVFPWSDDLTPQGDQPGSLVTIDGEGFCSNAVVEFGNKDAVATPVSVNPSGSQITVRTPKLATDGPLTVENIPAGSTTPSSSATSAQTVTINSYRNINGYQFHNYTPHIDFAQMTQAFGEGQTYISINLCIFGCTVHIRNLLAMALNAVANAAIGGGSGGACFGFSLSTQRILMGQKAVSDFPNNSNGTIFGLDTPSGPSGPLTDYINAMAVSQFSGPFLHHWLSEVASHIADGGSASAQDVYNEIHSILAQGRYPLIALRDGSKGHVVVAYNLEGSPGNYFIDVYDSNEQFESSENSNADFHQSQFNQSRISVDSHGDWSLQSTTLQGGMPGLVVTDPASLPQDPPMITSPSGIVDLFFGSAGPGDTVGTGAAGPPPSTITQLSDNSGHTLYNPGGSLNTNPTTRLDGSPYAPPVARTSPATAASAHPQMIVVANGKSALHATVTETGHGADTHTFLGPGFAAQVSTPATRGTKDTLTLAPAGGAGLATSATSKPVSITLIAAHGRGDRTAQISTTAVGGAGVMASFNAARGGLTFVNHGKATTFNVSLSDTEPGATPAFFTSGPIRIGEHGKATIESIRWSSLTGSTLKVKAGRRTMTIRNTYRPEVLASVASLKAGKVHHRKIVLSIRDKTRKLPAGTKIAFTWVIRRGRKIIATHSLLTAPSTRTAHYTFTAKTPGRYTLTAAVTAVILSGMTATTRSSPSRTLQFLG
jgi:hypothetical protein